MENAENVEAKEAFANLSFGIELLSENDNSELNEYGFLDEAELMSEIRKNLDKLREFLKIGEI